MTWITLPAELYLDAVRQGQARQAINLANGRRNAYGLGPDDLVRDLNYHIIGRIGEAVLSHVFGAPWTEDIAGPHHRGDVGNREIRATDRRRGHLLVRPDDPDGRRFYLVIITRTPECLIAGSILGRDAKQARYLRTGPRGPCFWIPQADLEPFTWPKETTNA